ncbi:uncharacterized protein LOC111708283 [Eurytemora carolleeae]|uniref:uncharacterized protein LOC111708283 n=1 Tax=Eurytemora carolleeae TaxID=1294199 RepID=UPI000C78A440|nr:uncharacterized protein LOC111708283 [Eurytemora carolleeae]|eukprot:XP_023337372.1 uncharacterized protein LOC111708283 [Eurytemora affinis]
MRATKTNQTLSEALGLEKSDELRLEPEEMEYVRELLEEHRLLSESFLKHHEIGTEQEFQIIEARTKLAGLLCKYQELRNQAGPLLFSESEKDKELLVLEKRMREEDLRINQIRMMIQKMMIGEKKLGQLFDKETNTRFKEMFLRIRLGSFWA